MPTIKQLRVVEAIGRLGSATEAASDLFVSQPAVSHALKGLERKLEVELFHRESGGMRPTPEGERLIRAARLILSELGAAREDITEMAKGAQGTIRIATECYTSYHWLPGVIHAFQNEFGHEGVDVVPMALDDPTSALASGAIDLAILHTPPGSSRYHTEALFADELVLVTAPDHRLSRRGWIAPEDLEGERLLFHSDPLESVLMRKFLGPTDVQPSRIIELRLTEAVLSGVKSGLGVTTLATWAVRPAADRGEVATARLGQSGISRTWYAAIRHADRKRVSLDSLVTLLKKDALGGLIRGGPVPGASAQAF